MDGCYRMGKGMHGGIMNGGMDTRIDKYMDG